MTEEDVLDYIAGKKIQLVSRVDHAAPATELGVHLESAELHWRRYEGATVRAPGFERHSNQRLPQPGARRFAQSDTLARDSLASPSLMEERSRLAPEIHDTLVQEFAGILLHLEAVEDSDDHESCSTSESLA